MPIELTEPQLRAWRAFLNAHVAVISRIERDLDRAGHIPLTLYDVLVALDEAPGQRLRLHDLASRVVLSRSGLTRLLDRLEQAGLARRERAPEDRRGAYATLTDAGRAALQAAWPTYAQAIHDYFATWLSDAELATTAAALERVRAANLPGADHASPASANAVAAPEATP